MNRADRTGTCVRPGLQGRAYTPRKARRKGPSNGPAEPPEPTSESHPTPGVLPSVEPRPPPESGTQIVGTRRCRPTGNVNAEPAARKAYGHRTFHAAEVSLHHQPGHLPEPELPPPFC